MTSGPLRYRMRIERTRSQACRIIALLLLSLSMSADRPAAQEQVAAGAPRVGQKAPDFTLPDVTGKRVTLSDLLAAPAPSAGKSERKTRWLVLIFYRGYW